MYSQPEPIKYNEIYCKIILFIGNVYYLQLLLQTTESYRNIVTVFIT